jgi:hypothetical protein
MHPNERPADIASFRALLLGSGPIPSQLLSSPMLAAAFTPAYTPEVSWREVFRQNRHLILLALGLLLVAFLLSL